MNKYWTQFDNEYLEEMQDIRNDINEEEIDLDKIEEICECHLCNDHGCNYCLCVSY